MINYLPPRIPSYTENLEKLYPEEEKKSIGITFQVTEDCCMACTYCYQHHKTNNKMTLETAKNFIDKLLNNEFELINTDNTFAVVLEFIGGEPLMEIELIQQIWEYFMSTMISLKHPWIYHARMSICSNGLLYLTDKVQSFFKKYNDFISLSISIDGNKELHDKCRVDLQGNKTYDQVLKSVCDYKDKYGVMPGTKMTLSPDNINFLSQATYNLINIGYTEILLNCIFEKGWNYSHAKTLYIQLKEIADYLINNNLYNKIFVAMFEENFFTPMHDIDNENWCGGISDASVAIDYKGDMHPCIRYMESSLNKRQKPLIIGNINTGYLTTQEQQNNYNLCSNITRRSQSTDECFYCPIAKGCAWCSAYNYEEFGTPNKRATYICCMHQARALANVYYWNTLYKYLNIDKKFTMHIPKEWALNIIDENEYNYLLQISI